MDKKKNHALSPFILALNGLSAVSLTVITLLNGQTALWALLSSLALSTILIISVIILGTQHFLSKRNDSKEQANASNQNNQTDKEQTPTIGQKSMDKIILQDIIPEEHSGPEDFCNKFLSKLAGNLQLVQAVMYVRKTSEEFIFCGSYALYSNNTPSSFKIGEGINGQVARNKKTLHIKNIPNNYVTIISGLGEGNPQNLVVFPILFNNQTISVVEIASFVDLHVDFNDLSHNLSESVGEILFKFFNK